MPLIDTRLWVGSLFGQCARIAAALDDGADIEARDEDGKTALMLAVVQGQIAAARLLIERGADVNAKYHASGSAYDGRTPLNFAINRLRRGGYKTLPARDEMLDLLRSNGAVAKASDCIVNGDYIYAAA